MTRRKVAAWWVACVLVGIVGCGSGGGNKAENKAAEAPPLPATGPNGGRFVSLGNREASVEIVPATDTSIPNVAFYLFDAAGKKKLLTSALEMVVNTKVNGASIEHKIPSAQQSDEYAGQTSRFRATEPKAIAALTAPGTELELIVTVGDKKLIGTIKNEGEPPASTATATARKPAPKPSATAAGTAAATGTKPASVSTPSAAPSGSAGAKASSTAEKK